eukprot:snap_masked-scaffold_19-processed-gene-3.40-mRNA-1 protein AED:1.00 eAED:1.00 QI:0/0/0/0/1/1/2/0/89
MLSVFLIFDGIIGFFFLIANGLLVRNLIQTIEDKVEQTSFIIGENPRKISILAKYTGFGLFSFIEEHNLIKDNTSTRTLLMAGHLSKCF